ncbi:MAG TPA: hypothetical protein VI339_06705 [Steroidobacteraceae bacterium]|nr:hypothetical protein [Steroidobacteraceae bacterium]
MQCLKYRNQMLGGAGAATALLLLSGCMTAKLEESRNVMTSIGAHEAVVLLAKPHVEGITAEDKFMDCVGDKMSAATGITVKSNDEFVDSMFPWMEPSTAPQRPEGVSRLLARDVVAERVAQSGVRYIIWVDGATRQTDSGGSITCTLSPAGGGCIGFGWWEKESDYQAVVWDLTTAKTAGSVSTNVVGTSALIGVLIPLPFIARVQGAACDRLADQLGSFLRGEDPSALGEDG